MSAAVQSTRRSTRAQEGRRVNAEFFHWFISLTWAGILVAGLASHWSEAIAHLLDLAPWIVLLVIANLLPLSAKPFADLTA
ncbi:MAG: hypothetical protein M3N24_03435, partial [Actinomycetota bacterium]|nr:hypothetical protein [Actinomycetota bacterium]